MRSTVFAIVVAIIVPLIGVQAVANLLSYDNAAQQFDGATHEAGNQKRHARSVLRDMRLQ